MGTTPIYNLTYPDFTDNVADGATAIQTLATNMESMFDVYGGMKKIVPTPTGHTNVTFDSRGNGTVPLLTGTQTVRMNNIFTSSFNAYRLHWLGPRLNASSITVTASFPNITTTVYNNAQIYMNAGNSTVFGQGTTAQTSNSYAGFILSGVLNALVIDVFNPATATRKAMRSLNQTGSTFGTTYTVVNSTTVATDFQFGLVLGPRQLNTSGTICIYGYNV